MNITKKISELFLQQKIEDCIAGAGAGAGAGDAILTSRVKMEQLHNTPDDCELSETRVLRSRPFLGGAGAEGGSGFTPKGGKQLKSKTKNKFNLIVRFFSVAIFDKSRLN